MFIGIFNLVDTEPCERAMARKGHINRGLAWLVVLLTLVTAGAGRDGDIHVLAVPAPVAGLDYLGATEPSTASEVRHPPTSWLTSS